jgi:CDP-4-dehydro-6-deoxyglucose reductase
MPDPKLMKPWHGVPRERIDWHPTVDPFLCIGCGTCVTGCSRKVYRFDFKTQKSFVYDPLNCLVGCTTCMNTCPSGAISFPSLDVVEELEERADVRQNIWHELIDKKTEMAMPGTEEYPGIGRPFKVTKIEELAKEVRKVLLQQADRESFLYMPGQYITVDVPGEKDMIRSYSIANAPRTDGLIELHIRLVKGGLFTTYIFEKLKEGEILGIHGPSGEFKFREDSTTPVIMLAVATGLAPMKAMLEYALPSERNRIFKLYFTAHNCNTFYGFDWFKEWEDKYPNFQYVASISSPCPGCPYNVDYGRVHQVVERYEKDLSGYDAYIAGAPKVIKESLEILKRLGVRDDRVFYDIAA